MTSRELGCLTPYDRFQAWPRAAQNTNTVRSVERYFAVKMDEVLIDWMIYVAIDATLKEHAP